MPLIKVSIIEDDAGFAQALACILNGTPGFKCLSTHGSGEEALDELPVEDVDVVLTDLSLPGMPGAACIRGLRARSDKPLFLVLTVHEDADRIVESLKAGATGYVLKKTPPAQILEAIAEMVSGGAPMSPVIARKVARHFQGGDRGTEPKALTELTDREREILNAIATGRSDKEIARELSISVHTVGNHIRSIYQKLHIRSRAEAVARYLGR